MTLERVKKIIKSYWSFLGFAPQDNVADETSVTPERLTLAEQEIQPVEQDVIDIDAAFKVGRKIPVDAAPCPPLDLSSMRTGFSGKAVHEYGDVSIPRPNTLVVLVSSKSTVRHVNEKDGGGCLGVILEHIHIIKPLGPCNSVVVTKVNQLDSSSPLHIASMRITENPGVYVFNAFLQDEMERYGAVPVYEEHKSVIITDGIDTNEHKAEGSSVVGLEPSSGFARPDVKWYSAPNIRDMKGSIEGRPIEKYEDASFPMSYTKIILVSSDQSAMKDTPWNITTSDGTNKTMPAVRLTNVQVVEPTVQCYAVVIRRVDKLDPSEPLYHALIQKIYYEHGRGDDDPGYYVKTATLKELKNGIEPRADEVDVRYEEYGSLSDAWSVKEILVYMVAMLIPVTLFTWWLVKYGCDYVLDCTAKSHSSYNPPSGAPSYSHTRSITQENIVDNTPTGYQRSFNELDATQQDALQLGELLMNYTGVMVSLIRLAFGNLTVHPNKCSILEYAAHVTLGDAMLNGGYRITTDSIVCNLTKSPEFGLSCQPYPELVIQKLHSCARTTYALPSNGILAFGINANGTLISLFNVKFFPMSYTPEALSLVPTHTHTFTWDKTASNTLPRHHKQPTHTKDTRSPSYDDTTSGALQPYSPTGSQDWTASHTLTLQRYTHTEGSRSLTADEEGSVTLSYFSGTGSGVAFSGSMTVQSPSHSFSISLQQYLVGNCTFYNQWVAAYNDTLWPYLGGVACNATSLIVSGQNLTVAVAQDLAPALQQLVNVTIFAYDNCHINDDIIGILAPAMKHWPKLWFFTLNSNNIDDDAIAILAPLLGASASLVTVGMVNNTITDVGAEDLAGALSQSILTLYLIGNLISAAECAALIGDFPDANVYC